MSSGVLTGHAHAGYGKEWIETLNAAIEVIPDAFVDEEDTPLSGAAE
jgi:hypothetical protein